MSQSFALTVVPANTSATNTPAYLAAVIDVKFLTVIHSKFKVIAAFSLRPINKAA